MVPYWFQFRAWSSTLSKESLCWYWRYVCLARCIVAVSGAIMLVVCNEQMNLRQMILFDEYYEWREICVENIKIPGMKISILIPVQKYSYNSRITQKWIYFFFWMLRARIFGINVSRFLLVFLCWYSKMKISNILLYCHAGNERKFYILLIVHR